MDVVSEDDDYEDDGDNDIDNDGEDVDNDAEDDEDYGIIDNNGNVPDTTKCKIGIGNTVARIPKAREGKKVYTCMPITGIIIILLVVFLSSTIFRLYHFSQYIPLW